MINSSTDSLAEVGRPTTNENVLKIHQIDYV